MRGSFVDASKSIWFQMGKYKNWYESMLFIDINTRRSRSRTHLVNIMGKPFVIIWKNIYVDPEEWFVNKTSAHHVWTNSWQCLTRPLNLFWNPAIQLCNQIYITFSKYLGRNITANSPLVCLKNSFRFTRPWCLRHHSGLNRVPIGSCHVEIFREIPLKWITPWNSSIDLGMTLVSIITISIRRIFHVNLVCFVRR